VTCDHHDLPKVCGDCSYFEGFPDGTVESHDAYWRKLNLGTIEPYRAAHKLVDPEGIEGTAVMPCTA
jgi:hypothetical protein